MQLSELLVEECVKAIPTLAIALLTLLLGWFVGSRISSHWTLRQRRKELDLEAARNLHSLYGEFFAVWKLWNYYIRDIGPDVFPEASRWELLDRACTAEAGVESMFVRLASERKLSSSEIEVLGKFRQAYQQLRETIRSNKALKWDWHDHPHYRAFKQLGPKVAFIVLSDNYQKPEDASGCVQALKEITDNKWEGIWADEDTAQQGD
jgi:hypothetical protein